MAVNFRGYLFNDAGSAINGATVALLETGTTTQEASTTTDSNGLWYFSESDQDRYDIKITSGSSVRYIRWDDQISLKEIDVRNNTGNTTPAATFTNLTNNAANQVAVFSGANSTRADNDEIYLSFKLADSAGNLDEFARITAVATDVTSGTEDGQIEFDVIKGGTLTKVWTITSDASAAMSFDMNVDALTIGSGADTDVSLTFDANSADGVITWMEDEDYFKFSDEILMNGTEKILFGDTATFIHQSSDGVMTVDGEATIDLNASTAVLVSNDLKLNSDSAVLGFGVDNDTTLTHTDGTGLTLNSTNKLTFGDTGTFIHQSSDGVLTITSDTTVDINGAVAFDGAITGATDITLSGELDAATLDISGNADIDGTTNLDAVDIDGAVQLDATFTVGVDDTGYDVKFFGATASAYMLWDASADDLVLAGAAGIDLAGDIDVDGTANLDVVDIDGNVQIDGTVTVGVDDTGKDVKFFGATSGAYLLWDESADKLLTAGNTFIDIVKDKLMIGSTAVTTTAAELNVLDAVTAGTVTASLGVVVDSNKDIGTFRNITLSGELDAGSLDVSGNADIDGTLETDALTIGGAAVLAQATTSAVGAVELATSAEINTSTDANRVITPDLFAASNYGLRYVSLSVGAPSTAITTGDGKAYFHVPAGMNGMSLTEIHAELKTAGVGSSTVPTIDLRKNASTAMLSTKITIDTTETGSDTAATAPALHGTAGNYAVATNDVVSVDIDAVGDSTAGSGLVVTLGFRIP